MRDAIIVRNLFIFSPLMALTASRGQDPRSSIDFPSWSTRLELQNIVKWFSGPVVCVGKADALDRQWTRRRSRRHPVRGFRVWLRKEHVLKVPGRHSRRWLKIADRALLARQTDLGGHWQISAPNPTIVPWGWGQHRLKIHAGKALKNETRGKGHAGQKLAPKIRLDADCLWITCRLKGRAAERGNIARTIGHRR